MSLREFIRDYAKFPMSMGSARNEYLCFKKNGVEIGLDIKKEGAGYFSFSFTADGNDYTHKRFLYGGIKRVDDLYQIVKENLKQYIEEVKNVWNFQETTLSSL